jgi:MarR family transcriptional regulator, lower aerobic nicotinate degradation pathway regulator
MNSPAPPFAYRLDEQAGYVLRQAQQRHATLFAAMMIEDLTPTQWAAVARLAELGPQSQNQLGRLTAMDAATIKGVIDRLSARGLTRGRPDPDDARRLLIELTEAGAEIFARAAPVALEITDRTLAPLTEPERMLLVDLLRRIT